MRTGLDRLSTHAKLGAELRAARVGLLAHPASVDRRLVHARRVLDAIGVRVAILFGPEHGFDGEAQDMVGVADARDVRTPEQSEGADDKPGQVRTPEQSEGADASSTRRTPGTPIRSLYGQSFADLSPRPEDLAPIDLLLIDLQDVGARYYTFVWTAVLAMRACVRAGRRVLVLDRPNPIGADPSRIEGRRQEVELCSFVGLEPIPIRHGLTLGEIVAWRAEAERAAPELVRILPFGGLDRAAHAADWDRPFVMPSPNMPSYETALVYPGGCLLEGTNLSEGRGTTRPFELVGAPWIDGGRLADELHALSLPGVRARPVTFQPMFQKHAGERCGGVQVHVTDPAVFRPVVTYVALIALARGQAPDRFVFRTERYEYRDDVPAFDLLTGSAEARVRIAAGDRALDVAEAVGRVDEVDRWIVREAIEAGKKRSV